MFTNFCFFIHNVGSRYARQPFQGSKEADVGLVSTTKLEPKNDSMDWSPGTGKGGQKNAKTPPFVTSPPGVLRPKKRQFFFGGKLTESVEWFEQLSSSSDWLFIGLQSFAKKVTHAGQKSDFVGNCSFHFRNKGGPNFLHFFTIFPIYHFDFCLTVAYDV